MSVFVSRSLFYVYMCLFLSYCFNYRFAGQMSVKLYSFTIQNMYMHACMHTTRYQNMFNQILGGMVLGAKRLRGNGLGGNGIGGETTRVCVCGGGGEKTTGKNRGEMTWGETTWGVRVGEGARGDVLGAKRLGTELM